MKFEVEFKEVVYYKETVKFNASDILEQIKKMFTKEELREIIQESFEKDCSVLEVIRDEGALADVLFELGFELKSEILMPINYDNKVVWIEPIFEEEE